MPFSNPSMRKHVKDWLLKNFPRDCVIVDVGAGAGAYYDLLHNEYQMIAIEAFERYVSDYHLRSKYVGVFVENAIDVPNYVYADTVVILGDVLEHFTVEDARKFLDKLKASKPRAIVVVVPYMYEQGPDHPDVIKFGNPLEVHHQPDLTPEVMAQRYPELTLIQKDENIGAYVWRPEE